MRRDVYMARTLLEHGADPNARITNWTPTRRASNDWSIHPALVGATPFWLAARLSQPEMMRLLAEHGADPLFVHHAHYVGTVGAFGTAERTEATTALMAAVGMGGPRSVGGFVDPDPSEAEAFRLEAVRLAVELGVDVHAVDLEGRTAADAVADGPVKEFLAEVAARR
jgi:ankyrin repeat protein